MQTAVTTTTQGIHTDVKPIIMHRRIGSIVYEVEIYFSPDSKESMNDIKLRLIRREMEDR